MSYFVLVKYYQYIYIYIYIYMCVCVCRNQFLIFSKTKKKLIGLPKIFIIALLIRC